MMTINEFAMNLISRSPQVRNNPNAQEWIQAIQNNDSARGEQIANNICQSYGLSRDEALSQATNFVRNAMNNRR